MLAAGYFGGLFTAAGWFYPRIVAEAACWGIGVLLAVAATQFLNSLLRAVWDRNAGILLGAVGLGTAPFWTRGLGRVLHWQRHAMATGFRNE